jgi:hypothetical protein
MVISPRGDEGLLGWMADPITCRLLPKHLLASDILLVTKVFFCLSLSRSTGKSNLMVEEIDWGC